MLRKILLALGTGLFMVAAVLSLRGQLPAALWCAVNGTALTAGIGLERWRYQQKAASENATWQDTGERSLDPETGQIVQVEFDPNSGNRRYVSG